MSPRPPQGSSDLNPYQGPRSAPPGARTPISLRDVWPVALGGGAILSAARLYLSAALSPAGFVAGALLATVGWLVGRIIAGQRGARWLTILASGGFSLALGRGWIQDAGGELTLWAFSCMSGGLLAGACGRPVEEEDDEVGESGTQAAAGTAQSAGAGEDSRLTTFETNDRRN